jgi:hypothetical protein
MTVNQQEAQTIRFLSEKFKLPVLFVKALVGLSQPARSALLVFLNQQKTVLQGKTAKLAFTKQRAEYMRQKQLEIYNVVAGQLDLVKSLFSTLNLGPEFNDDPEIQNLINFILSTAQVKGITISGFKDVDNIANAVNYGMLQAAKAVDFSTEAIDIINDKINYADRIIEVLSAIG